MFASFSTNINDKKQSTAEEFKLSQDRDFMTSKYFFDSSKLNKILL